MLPSISDTEASVAEDADRDRDRDRVPDALANTSRSLLDVFDHASGVYVFVKNVRREFVACSSPFLALMGFRDRAELYGKKDEDLSPPHLAEHYRHDDEQVIHTGRAVVDLVELVRNSDGGHDWFLSSKTALRNPDGTIVGLVGLTRALSDHDVVGQRVLSLTPAVDLISREYGRAIRVDELSALVSMSTSHFNRLFRRHFGVSPYRYLRRVRMMAACDLLATTALPVGVVGRRTGFHDPGHFANEFRSDLGMSPSEYRKRYGADAIHHDKRAGLTRSPR